MGHATFTCGDLEAVIGDNAAHGDHRAGYNGVWSLKHRKGTRNVFMPAVAGLNLEHVFNGETEFRNTDIFFEPRRAPMTFKQLGPHSAELHQPPTPNFHVESWTRFTLRAPHYIDFEFRCKPHQHAHPRGWFGVFWASYMNAPEDKSIYFPGGWRKGEELWSQLCTQEHNDESTVRHFDDELKLEFAANTRDALFKNHSRLRFAKPYYYGHIDDLVFLQMFERSEGVRFTQSPSGGGVNAPAKTTNPAWDFQFIVPKYEVPKEYNLRACMVLRPRCSREELAAEYQAWQRTLAAPPKPPPK